MIHTDHNKKLFYEAYMMNKARNNTQFTFNQSSQKGRHFHLPGKIKPMSRRAKSTLTYNSDKVKSNDYQYALSGSSNPQSAQLPYFSSNKTQKSFNSKNKRIGIRNQELFEKEQPPLDFSVLQPKQLKAQRSIPQENPMIHDLNNKKTKKEKEWRNISINSLIPIQSKQFSSPKFNNYEKLYCMKKQTNLNESSPSKLADVELGYLLDEEKVEKIKKQINLKIKNKKKSIVKAKPQQQHQQMNSLFFPEEFTSIQQNEKLIITFRTSLTKLKETIYMINSQRIKNIQIKVPTLLLDPNLFFKISQASDTVNFCQKLFKKLCIPSQKINIKKYINCFVVVSENICLICHGGQNQTKKIYLGGWKQDFDEGEKYGVGLQWFADTYVYFGEFKRNKRNGYGIMKDKHHIYGGSWKEGKHCQQNYEVKQEYFDLNDIDPFERVREINF